MRVGGRAAWLGEGFGSALAEAAGGVFIRQDFKMGIIDFFVNLLSDPRMAIEGWIAAGPSVAYGFIFLIIFIETGEQWEIGRASCRERVSSPV